VSLISVFKSLYPAIAGPLKPDDEFTSPHQRELITYKKLNDDKSPFSVIAHRGASYYAPENTMAAFELAHEMNADMIELDVLLSSDQVPVVLHDPHLKRTTNGNGNAQDFTTKELKKLDAGTWFSSEFRDEKIPTLQEVLEWASGKIALNIEIKPEAVTVDAINGIEAKTVQLVKEAEMEKHVVFSSFDYRAVGRIKKRNPEMITALLYNKKISENKNLVWLANHYNADGMNLNWSEVYPERLKQLREHNIPVWVYTVNEPELMKHLINRGISGIFSDRPDLLRHVAGKEK